MTIEHEARAEAFKRYDGDRIIDENTGEEVSHDDWGYAEMERQAFIAGAEWAAERLSVPPSDDEREALAQALFRTLYDAGVSFQSGDLIPRLTATVRAAGFRRQGPITEAVKEQIEFNESKIAWTENNFLPGPYGAAAIAQYEYAIEQLREALEAAERARSAVPSTTEQESDRG